MTPRILFIGNSHLGCIKLALDQDQSILAGFNLDFIIVANEGAADLIVSDGQIQLTTDRAKELANRAVGTITEANLADYHAIVLVGLGLTMISLGRIYLTHRLLDHRHGKQQLISRPAIEAMATGIFDETVANKVVNEIRPVANIPILLLADPPLSESVRDVPEWEDVWMADQAALLAEINNNSIRSIFSPKSVDVLEPPRETIVEPYFTKLEYSVGALNLLKVGVKKFKNDHRHMNAAYGALLCVGIKSWLESHGQSHTRITSEKAAS